MLKGIDRAWLAFERLLRQDRAFVLATLVVLALAAGRLEYRTPGWHTLYSGDAHEYALIARRIAAGEGFTTPVIFPAALLRFGAGPEHPSFKRPPLWPLLQAAAFRVVGPRVEVIHGLVLLCVIGATGVSMALGAVLAGRGAAVVAGLAVATCDSFLLWGLDGVTEPIFALVVTLGFFLYARSAPPFALGLVCGLVYLARENGAVMLPIFVVLLWFGPDRTRRIGACVAGFALVAAPWMIRNTWVAGSLFYSLNSLAIYFDPEVVTRNTNPIFQLDTSNLDSSYPLRKFRQLLWQYLRHPPFLAANAAAFAGVLFGAARGNRACLAWCAMAAVTLLLLALVLPFARYFAPLLPAMLALGVAVWVLHGGVLRAPLLILLVLMPFGPAPVAELKDLSFLRQAASRDRADGLGAYDPAQLELQAVARRRCLTGRPLVIAEEASPLAWQTDAISIHMPSTREDFWRIVDAWDVRFVQIKKHGRVSREELLERFEPRPDCGPDIYERLESRGASGRGS